MSHVQINHVWKDSLFHGHQRPVRNTTKWDDYPSQGIHWRKGCFWQKWMEHGATAENCHARINVPKKKRIQSSGYYLCLEHRNAGHCGTKPNLELSLSQTTIFWDTVDGRNPAPVDWKFVPSFTGFYPSEVVSRISSINSMSQTITVLLNLEVAPYFETGSPGGGPSAVIKGPLPKCGNETANETWWLHVLRWSSTFFQEIPKLESSTINKNGA